jgi:hypothetical protein
LTGGYSTISEEKMTTSTEPISNQDKRPLWLHLLGIIDRPVATFEAVLKQRKWLTWALPLFVVILAFVIVTVTHTPYTLELSREQLERRLATMPPEQAEVVRTTTEFTLSLPFVLATGLGVGTAVIILGLLIQSAFFYFGALIIGGNDMNFGAVFTMSTWARIPLAIGYLVQTALIIVTKSFLHPGLSYLVATGDLIEDSKNPLFILLSNIDIFRLWHLLLAVLGLSVVARISRGKSLILVVIYAILAVGITVGPTLFLSGMAG